MSVGTWSWTLCKLEILVKLGMRKLPQLWKLEPNLAKSGTASAGSGNYINHQLPHLQVRAHEMHLKHDDCTHECDN